MSLMEDLITYAHKSIAKDVEILDPVTEEGCIPLRTENGLTAWKFGFTDKVLWLPSGSIKGIVDFGSMFKVISSILLDYSAEYEVYNDMVGMTAVALGISDNISFSDQNNCIEQNIDSVKFGTPQIDSKKTKTVGIFFGGGLANIVDDKGYSRVYVLIPGGLAEAGTYSLLSMMRYSNREVNYLVDMATFCGRFVLIRYKRVEGNAIRGPVEREEIKPEETDK